MASLRERGLYDSGHVDLSRSAWSVGTPSLELPSLEGERAADVVVVGAGLAGSSLALHLAELGARVALIEAREPGWGASGRNAGHVVPLRDLDRALAKLPDRGEAFLELLRDGGDIVYRLAERHGIDCDAVQGGHLQVAHREALAAAAEAKAEKWARRGFAVRPRGVRARRRRLRDVPLELDAYWTGSMAWSTDLLPRIFEFGPGLYALTCFSGEGNVLAPLLGRHLAERLAGDDLEHLALPLQPPSVPRWRGRYDFALRKLGVPALVLAERLGLF